MVSIVTSDTQIANLALTRMGHYELIELASDTSKEGRVMRAHYGPTRDLLLRSHPWNWAIKRVALAASATAPTFGYTYAYPLPDDFLKMVETDWNAGVVTYFDVAVGQYVLPDDYRIERVGSQLCIVTDESTCKIEYVAQITDPALYDPLFVDLFAQRLAAETAYAITQNRGMSEQMWQIYADKWADAVGTDGQEGSPRAVVADTWVASRF